MSELKPSPPFSVLPENVIAQWMLSVLLTFSTAGNEPKPEVARRH